MNQLYLKYSERLNLVTVYIMEAHATDEWRLQSSQVMVQQPKSTAERMQVAREFRSALSWRIPIWCDPPEEGDPFEREFAPWPLRFYIVRPDRTLAYVARPVDETYDLVELQERIGQVLSEQTSEAVAMEQ